MLVGYCRVSTLDQNASLQVDALRKAGCKKIFTDKITGTSKERPELDKAKEMLREGDTLVVWRLDRFGRSLKNLIEEAEYLSKEGIGLKSLQESIDTSTSSGKMIFHIFGALAEFERNLIVERTQAGLVAARARGRMGGRPKSLDAKKRKEALDMYNSKQYTIKRICDLQKISKPTLYKYLREMGKSI